MAFFFFFLVILGKHLNGIKIAKRKKDAGIYSPSKHTSRNLSVLTRLVFIIVKLNKRLVHKETFERIRKNS